MAVAAHDGCRHSSKARERDRYRGHAFAALQDPLAGVFCQGDQLAAEVALTVPEEETTAVWEVVSGNYPFHHQHRVDQKHRRRSCRPSTGVVH